MNPADIVANLNTIGPRPGVWGDARGTLKRVAADLRDYGHQHNVTFVAVDNDLLERMREIRGRDHRPENPGGMTSQDYWEEHDRNEITAARDMYEAVENFLDSMD